MKNLQVRTTNKLSNKAKYSVNLNNVIVFLSHEEDKISFLNPLDSEMTEIQVYNNGEMIFSGDKYELFQILQTAKANQEYINQ